VSGATDSERKLVNEGDAFVASKVSCIENRFKTFTHWEEYRAVLAALIWHDSAYNLK